MAGERILVVEDEPNISRLVRAYLERDGFEVREAADGDDGWRQAQAWRPDLVVLDLMLPRLDGWEVCRRVRSQPGAAGRTPVIILTAKGEEFDRVLGLELGADDYVTKPFSPRELAARVRAVLRRAKPPEPVSLAEQGTAPPITTAAPLAAAAVTATATPAAPATVAVTQPAAVAQPAAEAEAHEALSLPDFTIDRTARELTVRGRAVPCPAKEFDLLWLLASHPDRVFSREALLERVWGYQYFGDARTVDVHVRRVRQKIEPDSQNPVYLLTVWGIGYKFSSRRGGCGGAGSGGEA